MIHNIVKDAVWPQKKEKSPRKPRGKMSAFPNLYKTLENLPSGDTVAIEMLDGQEAENNVRKSRLMLNTYKQDLRGKFQTQTSVDGTVLTLYIRRRYGALKETVQDQ